MLQKTSFTTTLLNPITKAKRHGSLLADKINEIEPALENLSDADLKNLTAQFRHRLAAGETLDDLLVEAFAAVRESSKRSLGLRHYDVQLMGGVLLHEGNITEMRTGEGKTLMATLPLYLNALLGRGSHLITANDYLARRDARWMYPIFATLGMSVGVLQLNTLDPSTPIGFLVDPLVETSDETTNHMRIVGRSEANFADVTYGTCSEFGFDYLRDNLVMKVAARVQNQHYYAILDEVDNILIDEARTPLIISGPSGENGRWYMAMAQAARTLDMSDVDVDEKHKSVSLTDLGIAKVESSLGIALSNPETPELMTPEQEHINTFLEQALRAQFLYRAGVDYLVTGGKVVIIDDFTGRLVPGRRWADGLHQAVEAKEGVNIEPETMTQAMITIQNYFRMYEKLAGMSGTAATESEEFYKIYKLGVVPLPSRLEYEAMRPGSNLVLVEKKDPEGHPYKFYARKGDQSAPVFWVRQDLPDLVFRTEEAKLRAIVLDIVRRNTLRQPLLIGTTSVENSERISSRLGAPMIRCLMKTLLIRSYYLEKQGRKESERSIAVLQPLDQTLEDVEPLVVSRASVTRFEIDNSVDPNLPQNLDRLLLLLAIPVSHKNNLAQILAEGVPHRVLNARRHADEAKIIARAGAYGAVTVATNMAGRGVDIKLGGDLGEDVVGIVNIVLVDAGYSAYGLTNEERLALLDKIPAASYSLAASQVEQFRAFMHDVLTVKNLGGLHVIGSDRHESRRIDNQLRGRASRQGDPGSSRFYMSFEGDLLRKFGGDRMKTFTGILGMDANIPVEGKTISGVVTQTQVQVEGANFDARKRLLEYDDVLNLQRERIYGQRDQVMEKPDILGDVESLLKSEMIARVTGLLSEDDGAWRLLQYLETVLPEGSDNLSSYPSFAAQMLVDELAASNSRGWQSPEDLKACLLDLAARALVAEQAHFTQSLVSISTNIDADIESVRSSLYNDVDELFGSTDTMMWPAVADLLERLSVMSGEDYFRSLAHTDARGAEPMFSKADILSLVDTASTITALKRLSESVNRRLGVNLTLDPAYMLSYKWDRVLQQLSVGIQNSFAARSKQLLGNQGQIGKDLDGVLRSINDLSKPEPLVVRYLLSRMAWTDPVNIDPQDPSAGKKPAIRLNYVYLVSTTIASMDVTVVKNRVIEHLLGALDELYAHYGRMQLSALSDKNVSVSDLLLAVKEYIAEDLSPLMADSSSILLVNLPPELAVAVQNALGRWQMNEICREYLLRLITSNWIEYLTKVEALRVSVSMESYAQKDPLTIYKRRAADLFDGLIADIRSDLVRNLFRFRLVRSSKEE